MDNVVPLHRPQTARFLRRTEPTINLGVVVTYESDGKFPFAVSAHRHGIEVIGQTPILPAEAVDILIELLRRSKKQHAHLAAFPLGVKQVPLTEDELKEPASEQAKGVITLG